MSGVVLPGGCCTFCFIWLVAPVIVIYTCVEAAERHLFLVLVELFTFGPYLLLLGVPGGGVPYFLVMMSF